MAPQVSGGKLNLHRIDRGGRRANMCIRSPSRTKTMRCGLCARAAVTSCLIEPKIHMDTDQQGT
jgi:hypothetical protein